MTTFHGGKLASLSSELEKLRPRAHRPQTNEEILAAMRMIRATMGNTEARTDAGL
jgi:hypothetical protein